MKACKAVLFFCEGPHDVAFLYHVLTKIFGFKVAKEKFEEFPAPFNNFFMQQMRDHVLKDLSLDMAHKFFLPDLILKDADDTFLLVFNAGGKGQRDKVADLIGKLTPLLSNAKIFPAKSGKYIDSAAYIFLYDADHSEATIVHNEWYSHFKSVNNQRWLEGDEVTAAEDPMGAHCGPERAIYVWAGNDNKGTLEDILIPIISSQDSFNIGDMQGFLKGVFDWDLENTSLKSSTANKAKLLKSVITVAGQRQTPGASMNVVIRYGSFIDKTKIESSPRAMAFCKFLSAHLGLSYALDTTAIPTS